MNATIEIRELTTDELDFVAGGDMVAGGMNNYVIGMIGFAGGFVGGCVAYLIDLIFD
jgi:hypothetical protein